MRNRFKGLALIDRVPDELWTEVHDIVQEALIKKGIDPQEKEMQISKMAIWGGLRNSCEKKRSKKQSRKGKIYPTEFRVPKNSMENKKAFLTDQCKEIEANNRMGTTTHSSTLAWKIPWMEEPGRLQSMGSQRHDWATSLSLFTFMHWRRKWQPTPMFLPGESQGQQSLVGCPLWGHTELDTTKVT